MRWVLPITVPLASALILASHAEIRAPFGYDLQGRPVVQLESSPSEPVVLFFLATDCPISNRYAPEIQRLEKEFAGKPVAFWIVYPNATETEIGIRQHRAAHGLNGAAIVRPQKRLMALAHPTVTPEAVVLVPDKAGMEGFRAAYIGRIDDRYVAFGRERPQATRHDLEAAISAVLHHEAAAPPGGPPVGCGIVSEQALQSGAGQP